MRAENLDWVGGVFGFRVVDSVDCSSGKVVEIFGEDDEYYTLLDRFDIFWASDFVKMGNALSEKVQWLSKSEGGL